MSVIDKGLQNSEVTGFDTDTIIDGLTLFDDALMGLVFDRNIAAAKLILRIILDRNIRVESVRGQEELRNPLVGGRNIRLDVHAIDENGEHINIEVQNGSDGAHVRRARFHSSALDVRMLKEKQPFQKLRDSYVVFIYNGDKFRKGLPAYHIDRRIQETGKPFEDGSHIIYVNGKYRGNDELGQLMRDFSCTDSADIHYRELADGVSHFKDTEEGRQDMSDALNKLVNLTKADAVKKIMENMRVSMEEALDALCIQGKERKIIATMVRNQQKTAEAVSAEKS